MIVALGLPLKIGPIILGCILSMLFSDFWARPPIGIPTPPIMELTVFYHANAMASIHPLPGSWYLIYSLWVYLRSCMHFMSTLWSIANAVTSGSFRIVFKFRTLNAAFCIVRLHSSNFCFSLRSIADFSSTEARAPTSAGHVNFLPAWSMMRILVWVMAIFRWLLLF